MSPVPASGRHPDDDGRLPGDLDRPQAAFAFYYDVGSPDADQAAERIVDANSYIYLYNPSVLHAWSADVSGYEVRPDKAVNLEAVSVS